MAVSETHYAVAVWGRAYVDTLLDIALPSQISAGNLAGLKHREGARYRIFTTPEDAARIEAAPVARKLAELVSLDIVRVDRGALSKYKLQSALHLQAIEDARAKNAGIVFLPPDVVVADGALTQLEAVALGGAPAVMVAAPRIFLPSVGPILRARRKDETLTVPPRDLARLALAHLHPVTEALFWGRPWFSAWPSALYWRLGGEDLLARYWHMHPLYIRTDALTPDFARNVTTTIDGDFFAAMDFSSAHFVSDSDEILLFELSDDRVNTGLAGRRPRSTVDDLVGFANRAATPAHRAFIRRTMRYHTGEPSQTPEAVAQIAASEALIDEVLARLEAGDQHRGRDAATLFWRIAHRAVWTPFSAIKRALR